MNEAARNGALPRHEAHLFASQCDGVALAVAPGVVPADALVVLSRTNLRTVSRLLVAIDALRQHYGDDVLRDMLTPEHIPSEGVGVHHDLSPSGQAPTAQKQARADAVKALISAMRRNPDVAEHLAVLGHR